VVLLNRGNAEARISANWEDLGYPEHLSASVRDLWQHKDVGTFTGKFSSAVPPHGIVMVRISPSSRSPSDCQRRPLDPPSITAALDNLSLAQR